MGGQPSLHVVARDPVALVALLNERLGWCARVRQYRTLPHVRALGSADVLIIDLDDPEHQPVPRQLLPFLDGHEVWLAYGNGSVSAQWLDAAHWPNLHFVHCDGLNRVDGVRGLAAALAKRFVGPAGSEIAALVLARESKLNSVERLVRGICDNPWAVRRPSQLAAATGVGLTALKRSLRDLGFGRVEHFITYVRWIAFEQLVSVQGLRVHVAQHLTGIADASNQRRQLDRLRRGSPFALRKLQGLIASISWLLVSLGALACRNRAEGQGFPADQARGDSIVSLPVVGAVVRRGDLVLTIRTTGQIRAERQVGLKSETQGTVLDVLVRPGDHVDSGQIVARLDPRPFDLAVREAQSQVADAQVRYRDILLGDDTTATAPAALERRHNARLRAGVDGAEARLERAELDRERATFRTPFAGTMDQVQVVPGQRLAPGDAIAQIVDLESVIVEAAVLEHDLELVHRGAGAAVSLGAAEGRIYSGKVFAVLPLVDTATRSGRVLLAVRGRNGVLRPGMYADVEVEAARLPDRVVIPTPAVIEREGRPLVFRYRDGRTEWVYVTPGRSNGRETEIRPDPVTMRVPIATGDTVLVEGHLTLTHDAFVRLTMSITGTSALR